MRKIYAVMVLAIVAMSMSSCFNAQLKENEDWEKGKVFKVEKGTIVYSNGITLRFADFGMREALDFQPGSLALVIKAEPQAGNGINDMAEYEVNRESKQYFLSKKNPVASQQQFYFGVREAELKLEKKADGTVTVAGKKCTKFVTNDGGYIAVWKGIIMEQNLPSKPDGNMVATSVSDLVDESYLSLEGYKEKGID